MPGNRRFGLITARRIGPIAKILAKEMVRGLRRRFGSNTEITLVYTTREKTSWLKSVWGHVTRSTKQTKDLDAFIATHAQLPSLEEEVASIAKALPDVKIIARDIAEIKNSKFGPAAAVLDLLDLPLNFAQKYPPSPKNNVGEPHEMQLQFLEMNRTIRDRVALRRAKAKLADEFRKANGFHPVFEKRLND